MVEDLPTLKVSNIQRQHGRIFSPNIFHSGRSFFSDLKILRVMRSSWISPSPGSIFAMHCAAFVSLIIIFEYYFLRETHYRRYRLVEWERRSLRFVSTRSSYLIHQMHTPLFGTFFLLPISLVAFENRRPRVSAERGRRSEEKVAP